jgi:hypothetical protein
MPRAVEIDLETIRRSPLQRWDGWFLWIQCGCQSPRMLSVLGLKLERKLTLPMGEIVDRLKCSRCRLAPSVVELWPHAGVVHHDEPVKIRVRGQTYGPDPSTQ